MQADRLRNVGLGALALLALPVGIFYLGMCFSIGDRLLGSSGWGAPIAVGIVAGSLAVFRRVWVTVSLVSLIALIGLLTQRAS
jgi:hypothetical protein